MADFDWQGTCAAAHATGFVCDVVAGDMTGTAFGSYPVAEDGTFKFWVFADAYKATVTKESGAEVEEDIYESNNLGLYLAGKKDQIPEGQGLRINGEKYMVTQTLKGMKYVAKVTDANGETASHDVTMDEVYVMKKGSFGAMLGVKGGYWMMVRHDTKDPKQYSGANAAAGLAIGHYWLSGPDA